MVHTYLFNNRCKFACYEAIIKIYVMLFVIGLSVEVVFVGRLGYIFKINLPCHIRLEHHFHVVYIKTSFLNESFGEGVIYMIFISKFKSSTATSRH